MAVISVLITLLFYVTSLKAAVAETTNTPELVSINTANGNYIPPQTFILRTSFAPGNSLKILTSQGERISQWTLGSESEVLGLSTDFGNVTAGDFLGDEQSVIAVSPLNLTLADLKRGTRLRLETKDISGWPFACRPDGLCAWGQPDDAGGNEVQVENLRTTLKRAIPLGQNQMAFAMDISPDGKSLAVSLNQNEVDVYSLESEGSSKQTLTLAVPNPPPGFPDQNVALNNLHPRFIALNFGAANEVRFSHDSKLLAAANEVGINLFSLTNVITPVLLVGHAGRVSSLAFDEQGDLFSGGADRNVVLWKLGETNGTVIAHLSEIPARIDARKDGKFLAIALPSGTLEIWDVEHQEKALSIQFFPQEGGWFAVAPSGLFDASEGGWRHLGWRLPDNQSTILPIESFFRNYYQPGLIPSILAHVALPSVEPISSAKPVLPKITLSVMEDRNASYELTPTGMNLKPERIRFKLEAYPSQDGTPLKDLQVSHNGVVVKKWLGRVVFTNGVCTKIFEVTAFPWENRVAASVYTDDDLRSQESVWEKPQPMGYQVPPKTLHVVSVGVSKTQDTYMDLDSAASDAQAFSSAFVALQGDLQAMGTRVQAWNNEKSSLLLGAFKWESTPSKIEVSTLTNEQATHDGILKIIRDTVSAASPADSFIFYFAGHGVAIGDSYFLVPSDADLPSEYSPADQLPADFDPVRARLVSDADLQGALLELDVSHAAVILDACNSGAALKGFEVGPLFDPKGFGRLAYEKGIIILTATTSNGETGESSKLNHSYLNYALINDGLLSHKADFDPYDGRIELREWLKYAAKRAGELAAEENMNLPGAQLAPRLIPEHEALILWAAQQEPQHN